MSHSYKVAINLAASFFRVVINAFTTLIATRIVLRVLGASDYGLYNLLAGTIALLSFVNGALMVSAQRYFSVSIGAGDKDGLNRYYNATLSIHILLGLFIILFLFAIRGLLFHYVLNISENQLSIGLTVYNIMVISSAITVMTIPYSAIMNSHEDLVMMAVADIVSYAIKLLAALILLVVDHDLLLIYSVVMLASAVVKAAIEFIWSKMKYPEVKEDIGRMKDVSAVGEMLGFVGWNTLGSFAVVVRNQGVAIVLNVFFGTVINAAYGIANQVNSLVLSFATTLTSVFSPIIIQAKGSGDEERMRRVAMFSSKLSFLLSSMLALPILVFLRQVLSLWLGTFPDSTYVFCYLVVLSFLVLQLYPGINRAIYASGEIKNYQIVLSIVLVSILPVGAFLFKQSCPPFSLLICMLISQIGTLFVTVYHGVKYCGFSKKQLYENVVLKPSFCFLSVLAFFTILFNAWGMPLFAEVHGTRLLLFILLLSVIIVVLYIPVYSRLVLDSGEKQMLRNAVKSLYQKIKRQ